VAVARGSGARQWRAAVAGRRRRAQAWSDSSSPPVSPSSPRPPSGAVSPGMR
jgi:hypothetical protein